MWRKGGTHLALVAALAALVGVGSASAPAAGSSAPCQASAANCTVDQILSNETTFTTWASVSTASPVHQLPSTSSPRVATLRGLTEDGFPEIYIVLRLRKIGPTTWAEVRLPMRPANRTGWVQRDALDTFNQLTTELVLNRATERITLYRDGHKVLQVPAAIGNAATPTPPGHFWIREGFPVRGHPPYGPYAFGTSAYSSLTDWKGGGVVGLHGTNEPQLVGARPSHGCIRVRNPDILRLSRLISVGTPLLIL